MVPVFRNVRVPEEAEIISREVGRKLGAEVPFLVPLINPSKRVLRTKRFQLTKL